ncbi:MAG TPA: hypothetical protein VG713_16215, partial [Pirellulales bacterium]|nr:hypothetical protein [Pirellulales bacterium]
GEYRGVINNIETRSVLGFCDYGIVTLGDGEPFYLYYGAKRLVGRPDFWADDTPSPQSRVEILAVAENDSVALTVLKFGQPVAGAILKCNAPDGETVALTTDANGLVRWPRKGAGNYACYVGVTTNETGTKAGQAFNSKRDYATLDFTLDD